MEPNIFSFFSFFSFFGFSENFQFPDSMTSEKREKEERKSKNENTRLRRWGRENLTVLPYLRTYFRGLNAIRKSCFETLHTASCVTRTVLDRLCSDAGSSGTLRRKMLLFVVTRFYCCLGCLSKKRSPHTTCNPTWVLRHEHVNEMFGFLPHQKK